MASSTIPAAKAALVSVITTVVADPEVLVSWGWPNGEPPREWVMVGDVTGGQETATIGQRRREETYDITVVFSILDETGDSQTASERCFALLALLENDLRFTHTTLNGTVRTALVDGPITLRERSVGATCEAQLTVTIACKARI